MKRKSENRNSKIQIDKLIWRPDKEDKPVLEDISCTFEAGKIYGIIGPNGSGKTSLVKSILRFIEAEQGAIELNARSLKEYKRKELAREIAFVPQSTGMENSFQTKDIVFMGRIPYQKKFFAEESEEDKLIVDEAMCMTDCYHFRKKEVSLLSGGESQRVVTARAIAQDTGWLILDEPTSSLDVKHQIELMNWLVKLKEEKSKTIIAVLHDINIASAYCNNIILMKDGKIHSQGDTSQVLTRENLMEVYDIDFEIMENTITGGRYYIPYFGGSEREFT